MLVYQRVVSLKNWVPQNLMVDQVFEYWCFPIANFFGIAFGETFLHILHFHVAIFMWPEKWGA